MIISHGFDCFSGEQIAVASGTGANNDEYYAALGDCWKYWMVPDNRRLIFEEVMSSPGR